MGLSEIPDLILSGEGVNFQYLSIALKRNGEQKQILRGLNYLPYSGDVKDRIVSGLEGELQEAGFLEQGGEFSILGGGSICMNPYNETITLYGRNPALGAEEDREGSAGVLQRAFPGHAVSWYPPENEASEKTPSRKKDE